MEKRLNDIQELICTNVATLVNSGSRFRGLLDLETWARFRYAELCQNIDFIDKQFIAVLLLSFLDIVANELDISEPYNYVQLGLVRWPESNGSTLRRFNPILSPKTIVAYARALFNFYEVQVDHHSFVVYRQMEPKERTNGQGENGFLYDWLCELSNLVSEILSLSLYGVHFDSHFSPRIPLWSVETTKTEHRFHWATIPVHVNGLDNFKLKQVVGQKLFELIYPERTQNFSPFRATVRSICSVALEVIGYQDRDLPAICSINGQVVYPTIFESQSLCDGFLQLTCLPGRLIWNGLAYDRVQTVCCDYYEVISPSITRLSHLSHPISEELQIQVRNAQVEWGVTELDGALKIVLYLRFSKMKMERAFHPWDLLVAIARCYITVECVHGFNDDVPADSSFGRVEHLYWVSNTIPIFLTRESEEESEGSFEERTIRATLPHEEAIMEFPSYVYTVGHKETTQLLVLTRLSSARLSGVVHRQGCLGCAIKTATQFGFNILLC